MSNPIAWGSDAPVSMPQPRDPSAPFTDLGGGHIFGPFGLGFNMTHADQEVFYQPTFAPLPSREAAG